MRRGYEGKRKEGSSNEGGLSEKNIESMIGKKRERK